MHLFLKECDDSSNISQASQIKVFELIWNQNIQNFGFIKIFAVLHLFQLSLQTSFEGPHVGRDLWFELAFQGSHNTTF